MKKHKTIEKIMKFWKSLSSNVQKIIIVGFILSILLFLLIGGTQLYFDINDNYITNSQCNFKVMETVSNQLSVQEENKWLAILYVFQLPIKVLIIAIALAWVIHGVGFHLVKR